MQEVHCENDIEMGRRLSEILVGTPYGSPSLIGSLGRMPEWIPITLRVYGLESFVHTPNSSFRAGRPMFLPGSESEPWDFATA